MERTGSTRGCPGQHRRATPELRFEHPCPSRDLLVIALVQRRRPSVSHPPHADVAPSVMLLKGKVLVFEERLGGARRRPQGDERDLAAVGRPPGPSLVA